MDRPWKSNYNAKSAITILEIVDINEPWALVGHLGEICIKYELINALPTSQKQLDC